MSSQALPAREKPLLRGVSHEIAAFAAAAGALALVRAAPTPRAALAAAVYGVTLTALFAVSALYHRPTWRPPARAFMRRLDHSAIFLLIAGTYTPFCLLLGGSRGLWLLVAVWAGAALGVVQAVFWLHAPKALLAALCVGLGWIIFPLLPELRAAVGLGGVLLLLAGGLAYTAGAAVYALRRPDPAPRVFGYHEVFHALVVIAAVCHYVVVAGAVVALR
ncbi:PAQR family membrane homeostasis protein TrhA [Anaeromyxobacter diazotrophicus]|uniref:PAQR family membrane homeostasis protein TrhA n=1 Tax=Anaeromyxobacter diazotrophicus TaxID=2590199 RepID=UPI001F208603|nr:hemolysin III family protein [Anaeromyxobacter diazotrophicus]